VDLLGARAAELSKRLRHLPGVPGAFRSAFLYCNLTYAAAGVAFEAIVEERLERYLGRRFFEPLGMTGATLGSRPEAADVALGYAGDREVAARDVRAVAAAGGLRASVEDLTRWLSMHLAGGLSPRGDRVVSEAALAETYRPRISTGDVGPFLFHGLEFIEAPSYGFGWFTGSVCGESVRFHPALIDGFSAAVLWIPARRLGFVVLANLNLSPVPGMLLRRLVSLGLGERVPGGDPAPLPGSPAPDVAPGYAGVAPTTPSGRFEDPAYGRIELLAAESGPLLRYGQTDWPVQLTSEAEGSFAVDAFGLRLPMPVRFERDRIVIPLSMDPRVPPQVFRRLA
jgi:CubicO group peptidase (beta-lactamase class C family)